MDNGQHGETKMKSQDIVILLKLISLRQQEREPNSSARSDNYFADDPYSVRALENSLGISKSEINNSLNRSTNSGLAIKDREQSQPKANVKAVFEFIIFGLKYVFPVKPGPLARGMATSFAAPVLNKKLMSAGENILVWPDADGRDHGQSIEPLFKSVPFAAQHDERLYESLALVDAIRLGHARERNVAREELEMRLFDHA
jgi:hypothetical protein